MSAAGESPGLVTCRSQTCPCCATKIGTSLALAGLWLLLAVPPADVVGEHHPSHFWLVFAAAALSAWLAPTVGRAARHHGDARLLLVGLGFLAAALLCGLHALATPGVLLDHANGGFSLTTPGGFSLATPSPSAVFGAAAALKVDGRLGERAVRAGPYLRWGLVGLAAMWGVVSLTGLPRLPTRRRRTWERRGRAACGHRGAALPRGGGAVLPTLPACRSVVLLSIPTADVLLAEAMVAVGVGRELTPDVVALARS